LKQKLQNSIPKLRVKQTARLQNQVKSTFSANRPTQFTRPEVKN